MPHPARVLPRLAATLPLALFLSVAVHAADPGVVEMGKQRYLDNCAVCHGADGKGGGPFTPMLKSAPSDLTVLSAQNDGDFPFNKVYDTIDGRGMPAAHGTADTPIWGRQWKNLGTARRRNRGARPYRDPGVLALDQQ